MSEFDVDAVVERVAADLRKAIADAEARATEIISAAEREAEGIRARAEAEARDQVEGAKRALEELTARFGSGTSTPRPAQAATPPPEPPAAAEATPPTPSPSPSTPEPAAAPEAAIPQPPPESEPTPAATEETGGDEEAARLVAMKMALDGASRGAIEAELERSYKLADRGALLDEVLARVPK